MCCSTLPTNHPGREPSCTERAPELLFPRNKVSCAAVPSQSAQEPTEPLSRQGQGTTCLYSKQESFLLAKGKSTKEWKHLQQWCVSLEPSAKGEQIPVWICTAAPLFQPKLSTSKGRKFTLSSWQCFWNILLITSWFLRAKSEMKWSPKAYPDFVVKVIVRGRNKRRAANGYTGVRPGASKCVGIESPFRSWNQQNHLLEILSIAAEDSNFSWVSKELETCFEKLELFTFIIKEVRNVFACDNDFWKNGETPFFGKTLLVLVHREVCFYPFQL